MCAKNNDDSTKRNSIDNFLSDDYKVPNELKKTMEDEIECSSLFFYEAFTKDSFGKFERGHLKKQIDNDAEDDVDIEILNGWEFTEKTNINPTMKKYILTVVAITMK